MNPLTRFRDWWHAPVAYRLDLLVAMRSTSSVGLFSVDSEVRRAVDRVQSRWDKRVNPSTTVDDEPAVGWRRAGYSREEC